jgi:hypothetical protein
VNIGEYTQYWSWHFVLRQVGSHAALYKPRGQKGGVGKVPNTGEVAPIFVNVFGTVPLFWQEASQVT